MATEKTFDAKSFIDMQQLTDHCDRMFSPSIDLSRREIGSLD
jgi:hypothetical protein